MTYKMECFRCGKEMVYTKNEKMEELGWVVMDCPKGCDGGGFLVPDNNPYLKRGGKSMINIINELKEEVQRLLGLNPCELNVQETYYLESRVNTLTEVIGTMESIRNSGEISDGYHTFNELYHHRAVLFSVICNMIPENAWKSKLHDTGDMYDGMFIVGIKTPGGQATYHYDINPYWDMFKVKELDKAPKWDGHTPAEAIERIGAIEPKKGKWEVCGDYEYICEINDSVYVPSYQCSECCEEFPKAYNYCPNCGADMREE